MSDTEADKRQTLELVEERLRLEKRQVISGRVRIRTVTDHIEDMVRDELRGTRVDVERVPVGRTLAPDEAGLR